MKRKNEVLKINKHDWINHGRWVQNPLSGCFWCYWNSPKSLGNITRNAEFHNPLFLDGFFLTEKTDMATMRKILDHLIEKKRVSNFIGQFEKIAKRYEKLHIDLLKRKSKQPDDYLPKLFETYADIIGIWNFSIFMGDEIQRHLLESDSPYTEEKILEESSGLYKKTWLEEQSYEIRELAAKAKKKNKKIKRLSRRFFLKNSSLLKQIEKHVEKYRWFGTHHWIGEPYNLKKCLEQISGSVTFKKGKNKIPPKKSKNKLLKLLAAMTYWRTHCAEVTCKVVFESRPILEKYGEENGLKYAELILFSHREILKSIKSDKKLYFRGEIKNRKSAYGCYVDSNGEEKIILGKALARIVQSFLNKAERKNILRGITVSRGRTVRGKVKILIDPSDFQKFKKGDILVASETAPDFVPCMKKAAAIVTERGGLTSHAAIVSRELGVACIIGIKDATRILSDGDLVEVDVNKGVVRIVKRK